MKVLGGPIFFHYLETFFIEGYESLEEYANGTLHYERFFTIGGVHYRSFHCRAIASATLKFQLQKLTLSFNAAMVVVSPEVSGEPGPR